MIFITVFEYNQYFYDFFFQETDEPSPQLNLTFDWHYVKCPPENECLNGHHTCAPESEVCVDLEEGFKCECGVGYKAGNTGCEPVCPLGEQSVQSGK